MHNEINIVFMPSEHNIHLYALENRKHAFHLLSWGVWLLAVVWYWTWNISEVGLYISQPGYWRYNFQIFLRFPQFYLYSLICICMCVKPFTILSFVRVGVSTITAKTQNNSLTTRIPQAALYKHTQLAPSLLQPYPVPDLWQRLICSLFFFPLQECCINGIIW